MSGFKTKSIHGGSKGKNAENALNPPIFQTSTFVFDNIDHAEKVMSFESSDYVYTRGNNPTLRLLENRIAELEGGASGVAFSSGMGAISSVLFSLLKPGDKVIAHRTVYGSTYSVITETLKDYGVENEFVDMRDLKNIKSAIDEKTKVIFFETPSNPDLSIIDIKSISEIVRDKNISLVVDNTFATPYLQRPLELGADIVVHSATKYLCGHGDVIAGLAVAKDAEYIHKLKFSYMCEFGSVMSPFNAWLILRGLKTLAIRMREHEKNAKKIVEYLNNNENIERVLYPGLEGHPGHELASRQMDGYGAIISFELKGGIEEARNFIDSLKLFKIAVSLGDCESLVQLPALITHRGYPRDELEKFGLTEKMIRISVGLEDEEDLIKDIESALKNIK